MKEKVSRLSEEEIAELALKLDREQSKDAFYFVRRWIVSIWSVIALYFYDFSASFSILAWVLIFLIELLIVPRFSWDLRQDAANVLHFIENPRLEGRLSKFSFLKAIVIMALYSGGNFLLGYYEIIDQSIVRMNAFAIFSIIGFWMSMCATYYYMQIYLLEGADISWIAFIDGMQSMYDKKKKGSQLRFVIFVSAGYVFGVIIIAAYSWFTSRPFHEEKTDLYGLLISMFGMTVFIFAAPFIYLIRGYWYKRVNNVKEGMLL